jgi:hypothetical protein
MIFVHAFSGHDAHVLETSHEDEIAVIGSEGNGAQPKSRTEKAKGFLRLHSPSPKQFDGQHNQSYERHSKFDLVKHRVSFPRNQL